MVATGVLIGQRLQRVNTGYNGDTDWLKAAEGKQMVAKGVLID